MRNGVAKRNSANHERPRKEWIEIPVPAIINEETFAIAQELLTANKLHAPRRTIEPSICQGMVSCSKCGYARIELRRVRAHARSTTTAASARTPGGTSMVLFATIDLFAKISWIKLFGLRLSNYWRLLASSTMSSTADWKPRRTPHRQGAGKKPCSAI
jgi:hypothetical protein